MPQPLPNAGFQPAWPDGARLDARPASAHHGRSGIEGANRGAKKRNAGNIRASSLTVFQPPPMLKRWLIVLVVAALGVPASAATDDTRFSQSLSTAERTEVGLEKLSSDNLGVLDALVRRDTVAQGSTRAAPGTAATFSQRLSPDERRNAGFNLLSAEQLTRLDALVSRQQSAHLARTLLSPPVYISRGRIEEPTEKKKAREIHGTYSLSYGWGSGGYSEKSGSMVMTMEDPEKHFSISIGYSETHIKGPNSDRYIEQGPPLRP